MRLNNYITIEDFDGLGNIAKHYDKKKLSIAIEEAELDLEDFFGQYWFTLYHFLTNPNTEGDFNNDFSDDYTISRVAVTDDVLLNGGEFTIDDIPHYTRGLKKLIASFAYSRYILINNTTDTINGLVKKDNDFSLPTPLSEIKDISNHYRNIAFKIGEGLKVYLCENSSYFKYPTDKCKCKTSNNNTSTKRVGTRFKTIKR